MSPSRGIVLLALIACACESTECPEYGVRRCSGSVLQTCAGGEECLSFGSCPRRPPFHWETVAACQAPLVCRVDSTFPKDANCVEANRFCGSAQSPEYTRCGEFSFEGVPDKLYKCAESPTDPGVWQWSVTECPTGQRCAFSPSGAFCIVSP